jgi:hypothetical protein
MLVIAALAAALPLSVARAEENPLVGVWKLTSHSNQPVGGGAVEHRYGAKPIGYTIYTSGGHVMNFYVAENRAAPKGPVPTDAERAELHKSMLAYAGSYTVKDDLLTHHVEYAYNQSWAGTDQARKFKIEGKTLTLMTLGQPNSQTGVPGVTTTIWQKVE